VKIEIALSGLALVACTGPSTVAVSAPTARGYMVHIQRPDKVGDRTHIIADDESSQRTSARVAGEPTPVDSSKTTHVHVDGSVVVRELQSNGRSPLRDEMTVGELWTTLDGGAKQVLAPAGARVVVTRAAKKEDALVAVDEHPASKSVRDAIGAIFTLTTSTGPGDDEVFGTTLPQSLGGEWPVNGPLAEKSLASSGILVSPGAVAGTTRLVGVRSIDGVECLELENAMTVGALQSIGDLPPGSTIQSARIDLRLHLLLPIDEARAVPESEMTMTIKGTFTIPSPQGPVQVTLESTDDKRARSVR